jgi:hypothetical protein
MQTSATARLRQEVMVAVERESTARALYEPARELERDPAPHHIVTETGVGYCFVP